MINNLSNKTIARAAGLLYLVYIVSTILTDAFGCPSLVVAGDAAATAASITAHAGQFRAGFIGELVSAVLFFFTAWVLYALLSRVDKTIALLFLLLNLGGVAVQSAAALNLWAAQLLLSGAGYLGAFQPEQLQALALASLGLQKDGFWICQIFYSAWLFPLGYLVFKSGFLPKILGIILMVHCFAWLLTFLQYFLFPGLAAITYVTYPLGFITEFGLSLWLLIMGAKDVPAVAAG
jgi:hypothetical protein